MDKSLKKYFEELDILIREGRSVEARSRFQSIALKEIPRTDRVAYSELARRLNLAVLSLKALDPYVRPTGKHAVSATPLEKMEYAAALNRVGAIDEAISIFKTIEASEHWAVLFLQAGALFAKWDYKTAIPLLERYVNGGELPEYQRLVGEVNLAAALIYERDPRAATQLESILSKVCTKNHRHLHGYVLQLQAENAVWDHRWIDARKIITQAQKILTASHTLEALFVRKWKFIVDLYCNEPKSLENLSFLKKEASRLRHWETLRSIDYHVAVALKEEALFTHLLFGTPFPSLTDRLKLDYGGVVPSAPHYNWELTTSGKSTHTFSIEKFLEGEKAPKEGKALHRLIETLTSDFYRPFRPAEIHSRVFPGEYFNPQTSVHRVAQMVNRLRLYWGSIESPMQVAESGGEYRLSCTAKCKVKLLNPVKEILHTTDLQIDRLKQQVGSEIFGVDETRKLLQIPNWTAKRLLQHAVTENRLLRFGKGRYTTYQFSDSLPLKKAA